MPILPKFVKIVVNKILSSEPYPNLEAVDPLLAKRMRRERKVKMLVQNRDKISQIKDKVAVNLARGGQIPETLEEAEIFLETNIKSRLRGRCSGCHQHDPEVERL